jgi:5-methylcytosine-specific restriction endonuclease McrA
MTGKDPTEVRAHKLEYDRDYHAAHRKKISAERRARYANDPEYRERAIARAKASYAANREKVIARSVARAKADPEKTNAYARARYAVDPSSKRKNTKKWADANPEKVKAKEKRWRKAHPEECCARQHNRRARVNEVVGKHTAEDVQRQYDAQKGLCYWCKEPVGKKYHVDHVVPIAGKERQGSNWPCNLVIACPRCNRSKFNRDPQDFAGILL